MDDQPHSIVAHRFCPSLVTVNFAFWNLISLSQSVQTLGLKPRSFKSWAGAHGHQDHEAPGQALTPASCQLSSMSWHFQRVPVLMLDQPMSSVILVDFTSRNALRFSRPVACDDQPHDPETLYKAASSLLPSNKQFVHLCLAMSISGLMAAS